METSRTSDSSSTRSWTRCTRLRCSGVIAATASPPIGDQSVRGCQRSGPASPPAPAIARRGMKWAQPYSCPRTSGSGRSTWCRSTRVPPAMGVRRNSTLDAPAGSSSLPTNPPGDHHAPERLDHKVLTPHGIAGDIDREPAARHWVESGVLPHPRRHSLVGSEVVEHHLRGCLDLDGVPELSHDAWPLAARRRS